MNGDDREAIAGYGGLCAVCAGISAPPKLCLRDVVVGALLAAHVPLADPQITRSGLAVSPNGRVVRVALYVNDRGLQRPGSLWTAYLRLAAELIREAGHPVIETKPGLELAVGTVSTTLTERGA